MILHRDHIVIEGGLYRLSESAFVDVQFLSVGGSDCLLYPYLVVKDALGVIHGKSVGALPIPLTNLALATASCLPINLEDQPRVFSSESDRLGSWSEKSPGRRAVVWLHAVYHQAQSRRRRKVSYLELMLRTLEYASGIHVTFLMKGNRVVEIVTCFGREDRSGFSVTAVPDDQFDIVASSFVPVSETCET